jgi:hypothetical protein
MNCDISWETDTANYVAECDKHIKSYQIFWHLSTQHNDGMHFPDRFGVLSSGGMGHYINIEPQCEHGSLYLHCFVR